MSDISTHIDRATAALNRLRSGQVDAGGGAEYWRDRVLVELTLAGNLPLAAISTYKGELDDVVAFCHYVTAIRLLGALREGKLSDHSQYWVDKIIEEMRLSGLPLDTISTSVGELESYLPRP